MPRWTISDFLYHKSGSSYWYKITFDGEVKCNTPAPTMKAIQIGNIKYVRFNKTDLKAGKHMRARRTLGRHLSKIRLRDGPYHISSVIYI